MKKLVRWSLLAFFLILLGSFSSLKAQFAIFSWTDSTALTTATTTLTATVLYQQLTVWSDSSDVWLKWNEAKTWVRIFAGTPLYFGSSDKVSVLYVRTVTGTAIFYTAGLKTSVQATALTF